MLLDFMIRDFVTEAESAASPRERLSFDKIYVYCD